ncbi:MAG: hypothetical protein A2Y40_00015 [Candidatus Margulisbacteria bacterium GWF2_35_9]|nr:MAG: hypothetical protein A2Y40_00015 [Candidatus Margulisbacteria bacterium GWF2_35_9]
MIDNISSFTPITLTEFTARNSNAIFKAATTNKPSEFSLLLNSIDNNSIIPEINTKDSFVRTNPKFDEVGSYLDYYA